MTARCRLTALLVPLACLGAVRPAPLGAQCPDGSPPPCRPARTALDTARYVILPFLHREGGSPAMLDGADCAELLTEAFERWTDVRLADKTRVYDALERRGTRLPFRIAFDTGLAIARQLGAGRLVMGQLWTFADTLRLRASVYDAERGGPALREAVARVPAAAGPIGAAFNALADSLLGATPGVALGAGAAQTRSLGALGAYALGVRAIRAWDLAGAARHLRAAVARDSTFAHAYLWLGQVLLWAADSTPAAMRDRATMARRTPVLLASLAETDRALLGAQQAMFEGRWPDACRAYRTILAADSTNFSAWYGLADCNARDPAVRRDPADSARYVFRGSWQTAVRAYRRALLLAPSFNFTFGSRAAERLTRLLLVEGFFWRRGVLDGAPYYAFPELEAETLAFHPVPGTAAARRAPAPPTQVAALEHNRRILVEIAAAWAGAFPQEARAHRALAYALEAMGRITPTTGDPRSALGEMRSAARDEHEPAERRRAAVDVIRLLVKAGDFAGARTLADSVLRGAPPHTPETAEVAVLLGRPSAATRLIAAEDTTGLPPSADNEPVALPLGTAETALALLAYTAVAAPPESIVALERRLDGFVEALPPATRRAARSALYDTPARLSFDVLGPRPAHHPGSRPLGRTLALQWALAQGDTGRVRAGLDSVAEEHGPAPAAQDAPPDAVLEWAWLWLAVGDTAAAERYLDGTLEDLPGLYSALLRYLPLAGAFVRMMALRADVASARGHPDLARRWAGAVVTLWSGAEPGLQPTVARMRRLLGVTRR